VEIFKVLKSLKMMIGIEKSRIIHENCDADLEIEDVYYSVDYPCIC